MASSPLSSREEGCEYWPSFFARCLWGRSRVVVARVSSPQSETIWSEATKFRSAANDAMCQDRK